MLKDLRLAGWRMSAWFLLSAMAACTSAAPRAGGGAEAVFSCGRGARVEIQPGGVLALANVDGRTLALQSAQTSFSLKYSSEHATFLQDGSSAVLVIDDGRVFQCQRI